jgi:GntR family transcriptional regulator, rspAB operon transcriptional repressor
MAVLLRDSVYRMLRRAILMCEFCPGQELREQTLAEKYGVSRSPIRDSLLRLEQEKLVTVLPRQGYRVNPIRARDVEELFTLRLIISPACAAEAARADDAAMRELDRFRVIADNICDEMNFIEYNKALHCVIGDLTGNSRLAEVESNLVDEFDRLVVVCLHAYPKVWTPSFVTEHTAIIDAIQGHDGVSAARLAYDHIAGGQKRVAAALHSNKEQFNR